MSGRVNRTIFKFHSYIGFTTGIALLLIGLSGSILVFNEEIDHLLYSHLLTVKQTENKLSLDSAYHLIQERFSEMDYTGFNELPQHDSASYQFFMKKGSTQYKAFLDPYTGKILHGGERYDQWMDWLLLFHYTFTIPVWGDLAVAILSILLLMSCITGIVVYRKHFLKVILFKIPFKFKNWRTSSSSLHRIIGVWSLLFNVMIAITAFWMMRYAFTETNFKREENGRKATAITFSIDETLKKIKLKYPDFQATKFFLPSHDHEPAYVYGYSGSQSFFLGDYYDEIVLADDTLKTNFFSQKELSEKIESIVFPIHAGVYGNILIKIVYAISGLTPGLLSITGFLLWWRRQRKN